MTRTKYFLKRLKAAREKVDKKISKDASHGHVAAGMASEGYNGGYRDALYDCEAMLTHGYPNDTRSFWRE